MSTQAGNNGNGRHHGHGNGRTSIEASPRVERQDVLTGHAYDGIQEYDNPMPGWWKWLFVVTVVYSVIYFFLATLSGGQLSANAAYDKAAAAELQRQLSVGVLNADAETLVRLARDNSSQQAGAAVYATNCAACHNRDGSGLVGPNLTDDAHVHITKVEDIAEVVNKGTKNMAMPAWAGRLSPNDVVLVSGYVASLRGQNKPGKPPEGHVIPPWSAEKK